MGKDFLGGEENEWHIHDVGKNPKLSLGDWNIKLDLNADSTTNWKIIQTAIEYLDHCHAKGKTINPKKKGGKQQLFMKIGQSI